MKVILSLKKNLRHSVHSNILFSIIFTINSIYMSLLNLNFFSMTLTNVERVNISGDLQ